MLVVVVAALCKVLRTIAGCRERLASSDSGRAPARLFVGYFEGIDLAEIAGQVTVT